MGVHYLHLGIKYLFYKKRSNVMENWKIWLIVSVVCSLIAGIVSIFMFLNALIYCEPVWYYCEHSFDCEQMGGYCTISPSALELWWVIPFSFLIGFFIPVLALILFAIGGIIDWIS